MNGSRTSSVPVKAGLLSSPLAKGGLTEVLRLEKALARPLLETEERRKSAEVLEPDTEQCGGDQVARTGEPYRTRVAHFIAVGGWGILCLFAAAGPSPTSVRAQEQATVGTSEATTPAPNPHWSPEGCRSCHKVKGAAIQPIPRKAVDRLCLGCHNGVRAVAEAHPIGRALTNPQMRVPTDWPTPGGRLSCITCHDVRRHCRSDAERPAQNASFLRGDIEAIQTIATTPMAFCGQCHVESLHTRHNPHAMLDATGTPRSDACTYCHTNDMTSRTQRPRTGTPHLRSDVVTLCGSCHASHVDFFAPGHIGRKVPDEQASRAMRMNEQGRSLPLENGRVVCSTCHNPHQRGLFPLENALSRGAFNPAATGGTVPLRIAGASLCSACHGK